jgi:hypothetical protein
MRKLFFAASAAATLLFATSASADGLAHSIELSAFADLSCSFDGTQTKGGALDTLNETTSSLEVPFGSDGGVVETNGSLKFANSFCNGNHTTVTLTRDGFLATKYAANSVIPGFKHKIEYYAGASWGGGNDIVYLDGDDKTSFTTVGARTGDFVINIHVPSNAGPYLAGQYRDMLILAVVPTP